MKNTMTVKELRELLERCERLGMSEYKVLFRNRQDIDEEILNLQDVDDLNCVAVFG